MSGSKNRICVLSLALVVLLGSCTTGQYMSLKSNEKVEILGTVQTTFIITGAFRYRSVINNQAYIHLFEAAQQEYQGNFDIRDITWVIGQNLENNNYEYSTMGKVIRK